MAMNRSTHTYKRIGSFVELSNEKIRLSYESRLARTKLDLSLLKLGEELKPARLLGLMVSRLLSFKKARVAIDKLKARLPTNVL